MTPAEARELAETLAKHNTAEKLADMLAWIEHQCANYEPQWAADSLIKAVRGIVAEGKP